MNSTFPHAAVTPCLLAAFGVVLLGAYGSTDPDDPDDTVDPGMTLVTVDRP